MSLKAGGGRRRGRGALPKLLLAIALSLMSAPLVADWAYTLWAQREIQAVSDTASALDAQTKAVLLEQARMWNRRIAGQRVEGELLAYDEQLAFEGQSAMCWIEIAKISVRLPCYHHDDDEAALSAGAGHNEATSLPVGGVASNCVIAAHSGMGSARMFDDLVMLQKGDVFVLHTLGDAYAYRVVEANEYAKDDPRALRELQLFDRERDMCTLVTCTSPQARGLAVVRTNSHRLLVHGERCAYDPQRHDVPAPNLYVNGRTLPLLALLDALLGVLFVRMLNERLAKRRRQADVEA